MKRDNLIAEVSEINIKRGNFLITKGHDYADEDTLSNFKQMSQICQLLGINPSHSPGDCARYLVVLKLVRWCNLKSQGQLPKHESVKDTVIDLHNYIDLAYCCDLDEERKT